VTGFCDQVVLINKTVLVYGDTSEVFTRENLARTFGADPTAAVESARALNDP
ncbi:MAG: manganese transporter, partial [Prochlorococcaceae cyanobacterium]